MIFFKHENDGLFYSFSQEKALALKIGRQKKIQIIDGQHVEVFTGDDEEDEEDEEYEGIYLYFIIYF